MGTDSTEKHDDIAEVIATAPAEQGVEGHVRGRQLGGRPAILVLLASIAAANLVPHLCSTVRLWRQLITLAKMIYRTGLE
jgi:hypothetical protein